MRLSLIFASTVFMASVSAAAHACTEFNVDVQTIGAESYNPNTPSPVALQMELFLIDGPAEASCATQTIDITSRTLSGVRNLKGSNTTVVGSVPPIPAALATYTDSSIRLSQSAVAQLAATGRLVFEYSWIKPGTFYPAGRYSNILDVEVNGFKTVSFEPEIEIEPAIRLLGDVSDGQGNMDFGTLESNEEIATNFIYQSNAKINVTAMSENNGALVHDDGPGFGRIPYATFVNDTSIATDGTQALGMNGMVGVQNIGSIRLRLGNIGTPVAGDYSDILTLNFSAS